MKGSRYILSVIGLVLAAVVGFMPSRTASAQVNLAFTSGFQVQNLNSSTAANVTISFYSLDGSSVAGSVDVTIPAGDDVTYASLPTNPGAPANFDGSAVLSSDQRIAAIANVVSPDLSLSFGGEAYVGVTQGSTTVSLPFLNKAYFNINSFVNVQNVGQSATDVTITYRGGGLSSPLARTYQNLQPGAAHRFDQAADPGLPAGFNGSATVTSTTSEIAAVATQVGRTTVQIYNGFSAGSTLPVFPLVATNNFGFVTGITLQNLGSTDTSVTVAYTPDDASSGTACTETKTVPANGSTFFAIDAFRIAQDGENCANGARFVGSGRVTANSTNQQLVGIVNQLNSAANKGGAYGAFDPNAGTPTVVFPLIMDRNAGFFTGLSIVNAGTLPVDIVCTYSGTTITQSRANVAAGASYTLQQYNVLGSGYVGSGTCKASGTNAATAKLVGIANEARTTGTKDTLFVYEGANN